MSKTVMSLLVAALFAAGAASANTNDRHAGVAGTKTAPGPAETASMNLREGVDYQVVTFSRGSADLTLAQKKAIKAVHDSAVGGIDEIHVAVWSDQAFPRNSKTDLPDAQRDLAERRGDAIENYLRYDLKQNALNVSEYNMAESSNWFQRAFNTDEGELKSLFSQQGAPSKVDPIEFNVVRTKGGPMKAVILIERDVKKESDLTPTAR